MKYYEVTFNISAPADIMGDARDLVAALAGEAGFETFVETDNGLKGYVQTQLLDREALDQALDDFPFDGATIGYDIHEAENRDWNEQWEKEGFDPIVVDGACAIHDGRHLPQDKVETEVEIDAKLAFGTGNHETTRMIVSQLLSTDMRGKALLDAGCGTGILGIVALKRGASKATGYDIDEWSADNARHNAVINGVDARYEALLGDASLLDGIATTFDVAVANINRNILLADMPRLARAVKPQGQLILSGFYVADEDALAQEAATLGLALERERNDNGWACLVFRKE